MERRQPTIPLETQGQKAPIQLPPMFVHFTAQTAFSHFYDQFQGVFPMSRIGDDISAEKKDQRVVWRLHLSQHQRES